MQIDSLAHCLIAEKELKDYGGKQDFHVRNGLYYVFYYFSQEAYSYSYCAINTSN